MDITPLIPSDKKIINGYGNNGFVVNKERVQGHLAIYDIEYKIIDNLDINDINEEIFSFFLQFEQKPEIILIGTGNTQLFPNPKLKEILLKFNLKAELMQTGAACRTYNILLSEGRNVAALLVSI